MILYHEYMSLRVRVIFKNSNESCLLEDEPGYATLNNRRMAREMAVLSAILASDSIVENFSSATVCNPYEEKFFDSDFVEEFSFTREELLPIINSLRQNKPPIH